MATTKLSQIVTTTTAPATTDWVLSVVSGSTDTLVTYSQVATTVSPIITLASSQIPTISISAASVTSGVFASSQIPTISSISVTGSFVSSQIPTININSSQVTTGTLSTVLLPVATTSAQGIVSIGSGLTVGSGTTAISTALSVSTLVVTAAGTASSPSIGVGSASTGFYSSGSTGFGISVNGVNQFDYGITNASVFNLISNVNAPVVQLSSATTAVNITNNTGRIQFRNGSTMITSSTSASLQIGNNNSSTPIAQSLTFQSGSGTNIAGLNATIIGSLGTGNTTSGNIIFQVGGPSGSSGSTPIVATTAMVINAGTRKVSHNAPVTLPLFTVSSIAAVTGSATGDVAVVTDALAPTFLGSLVGGGTTVSLALYNGSAWVTA